MQNRMERDVSPSFKARKVTIVFTDAKQLFEVSYCMGLKL